MRKDNGWISVGDRLPDEMDEEFLVWPYPDPTNHIITASYCTVRNLWMQDWYNGVDWEDIHPTVTHWQSLPQPPR